MEPIQKRILSLSERLGSKRVLAWLCVALLILTTLPLYMISLYNHPYYDDYGFSARVHAVWKDTHSLPQVLTAAMENAQTVRDTWQGTYTGTLLSNLQPGVFSEKLYFITTFFLLSAFLFCFGFLLKTVFQTVLRLPKTETVIGVSLLLFLLVQWMPDPDEAFFWFNGGIGNTFIYSLLALSLGLCVQLERTQKRGQPIVFPLLLLLLMVFLGGGSYGGGVFGLLTYALMTLWGFHRKSRQRFVYLAVTLVFLECFAYNLSAPGNVVRAGYLTTQLSPIQAILQSFYYGVALAGSYVQLPLLAVTGLLLPFFAAAAKKSSFRFAHPWLVLAGGTCLYVTQLTPPLYSGVFIGGGRIVDTYYQSFVVMWFLYVFYLTGFVVRRHGSRLQRLASLPKLRQGLALGCCCLLVIGCLASKRPQDATFGPQNLAGGSAALSLVKGEAQQYHREMTAREAVLNDASKPAVTLAPLTVVPEIFMKDLLLPNAPYDVLPTLCAYYGKTSIQLLREVP